MVQVVGGREHAEGLDRGELQRRTVRTLAGGQAVGALGLTIGIATASLLARDLSGSDQLAGLAQTSQVLGAAFASWLLARLMARRGRRVGLVTGYLVGAAGSVLAVVAGVLGSLTLLLLGALLLGSVSSANYASRYAATDLATAQNRGRSLSVVVWATTLGAVAGPNLTGPSASMADRLGIPELTGPFALGAAGMVLAAVVIGVRLRPDPLLVARATAVLPEEERVAVGASEVAAAPAPRAVERGAPVRRILRDQPVLAAAITGLAAAHAVMIAVMVMTPLHMQHGGAALRVIGVVISVHVLGMFAFAPVVGWAADRFGRPQVLGAGGVVLLVSLALGALSPEGSSPQIFGGLFLLGLGWSLATVAASTIVAEQAPLRSLTDVQGFADLVMSLAAAAAGAVSGVVVGLLGFAALAGFASLFAVVVLWAAVFAGRLDLPALRA